MGRGVIGEDEDGGTSSNILVRTRTPENGPRPSGHVLGSESPHRRELVITFSDSAEDWLAVAPDDPGTDAVVLCMGDPVRSTAATTPNPDSMQALPPGEPRIEGIPDPTNLAELGLSILEQIQSEQWTDTPLVVQFDSLDALLDAVPLRTAFRFLHILSRLIATSDATAFYYASSNIESEKFNTIRVLFDAEYRPE